MKTQIKLLVLLIAAISIAGFNFVGMPIFSIKGKLKMTPTEIPFLNIL